MKIWVMEGSGVMIISAFFVFVDCIVMIVICMPNDGICPVQIITLDADMAENIILMGKLSKNGTELGTLVARMKQIPGTIATCIF